MTALNIRRHTGVVSSTGSRIFLVFRKIPDDTEYCLVVMADALPDQFSQSLDALVMSREAQAEVDLYNCLSRHQFADGSNVLASLHERKLLKKLPISTVDMTPLIGRTVPLSIINEQIDSEATVDAEAPASTGSVEEIPVTATVTTNTAPVAEIDTAATPAEQAKSMMAQAQEMKRLAEELKEQAITLDPTLKPKKGRPADSADEEAKKAKRNEKRRKAYAEKKAKEAAAKK